MSTEGTAARAPAWSDDEIRNSVLMELKWDPKITSTDIGLAVKDGVVTLAGFVPSYWEKDAAEKAAKRVSGVKAVANDLEVKLLTTRTDPEIARDIVHELESHIGIPAENIKATVRSGWVTIEGRVDWQYQKVLAEAAVKKIRGVIGVSNKIEVKPAVSPTDIKSKMMPDVSRLRPMAARSSFTVVCERGPREKKRRGLRGRRRVSLKSRTTSRLVLSSIRAV
jgi:osmotically-inducible protein OsmY